MRALALIVLASALWAGSSTASGTKFELPYDLVVTRDGTIYFTDRGSVMRVNAKGGQVRVHRRVPGAKELAGLARLGDGTLVAADLPTGRILRIPAKGAVTTVARVPMPVDVLADPAGTTVWVASIAEGVGLVRVDLASGIGRAVRARRSAARSRPSSERRPRRSRRPRGQSGRRDHRRVDAVRERRRLQARGRSRTAPSTERRAVRPADASFESLRAAR